MLLRRLQPLLPIPAQGTGRLAHPPITLSPACRCLAASTPTMTAPRCGSGAAVATTTRTMTAPVPTRQATRRRVQPTPSSAYVGDQGGECWGEVSGMGEKGGRWSSGLGAVCCCCCQCGAGCGAGLAGLDRSTLSSPTSLTFPAGSPARTPTLTRNLPLHNTSPTARRQGLCCLSHRLQPGHV